MSSPPRDERELDALRRFNAPAPPLDVATTIRIRASVERRVDDATRTSIGPSRHRRRTTPAMRTSRPERATGAVAVLHPWRIDDAPPGQPDGGSYRPVDRSDTTGTTIPSPRPGWLTHAPWLAAAAVILVFTGLAGAYIEPHDPPAARAATTESIIAAVAASPHEDLAAGQVLRTTEEWSGLDPRTVTRIRTREGTGSEEWVFVTNDQVTATSSIAYPDAGSVPFSGLTYEQIQSLPTDPDELIAYLHAEGGWFDSSDETARALADLLTLPVAPTPVRVAAIEGLLALGADATGDEAEPRLDLVLPGGPLWLTIDPVRGLCTRIEDSAGTRVMAEAVVVPHR